MSIVPLRTYTLETESTIETATKFDYDLLTENLICSRLHQ